MVISLDHLNKYNCKRVFLLDCIVHAWTICRLPSLIMWTKLIILVSLQICFAFDLPRKCISDLEINHDHYNISEVYNLGEGERYPTDAHYDVYGNLFYVEKR